MRYEDSEARLATRSGWSFHKLREGCVVDLSHSLGLVRLALRQTDVPNAVALKFKCASESSGGPVKAQIAGPHSQNFKFGRCWMRPENLHSNKFPGAADALRNPTPSCIPETDTYA